MVQILYPEGVKPNPGFWLNPAAVWASRRKLFRRDNSNQWRSTYRGVSLDQYPDRSVPLADVVDRPAGGRLRIAILGDTGEGDRSQYALIPVLRRLAPDLMVINGDVAYPAGRRKDFLRGFFRPYRDLKVPIWATPGNHEYYSRDKGSTFFHVFCTYRYGEEWRSHGLVQKVPQPGTYWELKGGADGGPPIALIGLDSGMTGDLDGSGRGHDEDTRQHDWLCDRLARAEHDGAIVVALFHIPGLVNGGHIEKVHLRRLHRLLAESPAVRLVVCGHIHNHQYYLPDVFRSYLEREQKAASGRNEWPHYVVTGGGGAYISRPERKGDYDLKLLFPSIEQWAGYAGVLRKAIDRVGLGRAAIGRIASLRKSSVSADDDAAKFLSLLVLDVAAGGVEARHILMDDLEQLFGPPDNLTVRVDDPHPPINDDKWDRLFTKQPAIRLSP